VQIAVAAGAKLVTGQATNGTVPLPLNAVCETAKLDSGTLPVLVTTNEYAMF